MLHSKIEKDDSRFNIFAVNFSSRPIRHNFKKKLNSKSCVLVITKLLYHSYLSF